MTFSRYAMFLLAATTLLVAAHAKADDPKIHLCSFCTLDAEFAQAAEHAALSLDPFLFEGMQEVYVVNAHTEDVRYYTVVREFVGHGSGLGDGYWQTTVTAGNGDAVIESDVLSALGVAKDFLHSTAQGVDSDDLDFGQTPIDSAVDLLGPGADFERLVLQNVLANYYMSFGNQLSVQFGDLIGRVINTFVAEGISQSQSVRVEFPDGTSVRLVAVNLHFMGDGTIEVEFEVDESSVQGPGLHGFPTTPGGFVGLTVSGHPIFILALGDLFSRLGGGSVTIRDVGDSCEAEITCWEDEDGEEHCETTLPKPEISDSC